MVVHFFFIFFSNIDVSDTTKFTIGLQSNISPITKK